MLDAISISPCEEHKAECSSSVGSQLSLSYTCCFPFNDSCKATHCVSMLLSWKIPEHELVWKELWEPLLLKSILLKEVNRGGIGCDSYKWHFNVNLVTGHLRISLDLLLKSGSQHRQQVSCFCFHWTHSLRGCHRSPCCGNIASQDHQQMLITPMDTQMSNWWFQAIRFCGLPGRCMVTHVPSPSNLCTVLSIEQSRNHNSAFN